MYVVWRGMMCGVEWSGMMCGVVCGAKWYVLCGVECYYDVWCGVSL
jgi:hypothetical protein